MEQHLEDVVPRRTAVRVAIGTAAEAPLPQHCQVQRAAGLGEHGAGVVMGHVADVVVIDLQQTDTQNSYEQCVTEFYTPNLQKCLDDIAKGNQYGENATGSLTYKEKASRDFYSRESNDSTGL